MANSETSFPDRAQKAQLLLTAITAMSPAYAPLDNALLTVNVTALLQQVTVANIAVGNAKTAFSNAVQARLAAVKDIPKLATRVVNNVKTNPAWKVQFPRIKELCDKVRRVKTPLKTTAPAAPQPGQPPAPPQKPRDRGDGSYAELADFLKLLGTAVNALPGYNATDPDMTGPALNALGPQLEAQNLLVGNADTALDTAQKERFALYFTPETGLADVFAAIKQAVKGQYGPNSTQYAQVKTIRW